MLIGQVTYGPSPIVAPERPRHQPDPRDTLEIRRSLREAGLGNRVAPWFAGKPEGCELARTVPDLVREVVGEGDLERGVLDFIKLYEKIEGAPLRPSDCDCSCADLAARGLQTLYRLEAGERGPFLEMISALGDPELAAAARPPLGDFLLERLRSQGPAPREAVLATWDELVERDRFRRPDEDVFVYQRAYQAALETLPEPAMMDTIAAHRNLWPNFETAAQDGRSFHERLAEAGCSEEEIGREFARLVGQAAELGPGVASVLLRG